jgi:hypothetical protein
MNSNDLQDLAEEMFAKFRETSLPVHALRDPKVREKLKAVDMVWGFDISKNMQPSLMFGKERLEETAPTGISLRGSVMSFTFNSEDTSLDFLLASLNLLKGGNCYNE